MARNDARAYTKCITEDPVGRELLKAASGFEVRLAPQKPAKAPEFIGSNHAKLHSLAVDHQRAHPGMSYAQAYSQLYSRPENAALRML